MYKIPEIVVKGTMYMSSQVLFQTSFTNSYMILFYFGGHINCDLRDATFEILLQQALVTGPVIFVSFLEFMLRRR